MYISEADQQEVIKLIKEFNELTDFGNNISTKSNFIMNKIYFYLDKIILGIIFLPRYSFWKYAEIDDLIQDARTAIYLSIIHEQFKPERGSVFNFFSTVTSNTLKNITSKINRYQHKKSSTDILELYNNKDLTYNQNLDRTIIFNDIMGMLIDFFDTKPKFQELTVLLTQYCNIISYNKFVKKNFIQYAKGHNYSPAIVNTFFSYLKRFGHQKHMQELLYVIEHELHLK